MGKLLKFSLALLVAFAAHAAPTDAPLPTEYALPRATTEAEKLKILLAIKQEFPAFLSQALEYGFNSFKVLDDQQELLRQLAAIPEYGELLKTHGPHLGITVQEVGTREIVHKKADAAKVSAWARHLQDTLHRYPDPASAIAHHLAVIKQDNAEGVLSNLIKQIEGPLKGEAFRQPGALQKIAFLKSHPEIPAAVKAQLPRVEELVSLQGELESLTELALHLQTEPGKWLTGEAAVAKISRLGEADLNLLQDHTHFVKPRLDALNAKLGAGMAVRASVADKIQAAAKSTMAPVSTEVEKITNREVQLRELRPTAAIFRGCAGNDCSTSYSFAAPNSPTEMVFNITDREGASKGYLEAAKVMVEGKPALYISSINGPRISGQDVDLILEGLYRQKHTLGVENIVMPRSSNLSSLVNFETIRERFKEHIGTKSEVPITFTDAKIREVVENFKSENNSAGYDTMEHNSRGVIYEPGKNSTLQLEAKVEPIKLGALTPAQKLNKAELLYLALENEKALGEEFAAGVRKGVGVSPAQTEKIREVLRNPKRLPIAEFEKDVHNHLAKLLGAESRAMPPPDLMLLEGRLSAPDALSPAHLKRTGELLRQAPDRSRQFMGPATMQLFLADPTEENLRLMAEIINKFRKSQQFNPGDYQAMRQVIAKAGLEDTLLRILADESSASHFHTFLLLYPDGPKKTETYLNGFNHPDFHFRKAAAESIRYYGDAETQLHLAAEALKSSDDNVRIAAVETIEFLPRGKALGDLLAQALGDQESSIVRTYAARSLKVLDDQDIKFKLLQSAQNDDEYRVRSAAAELIGTITNPERRLALLNKVLADKSKDVSVNAVSALVWLSDEKKKMEILNQLAQGMNGDEHGSRQALKYLSQLKSDADRAVIIKRCIERFDKETRQRAIAAISLISDPKLHQELTAFGAAEVKRRAEEYAATVARITADCKSGYSKVKKKKD